MITRDLLRRETDEAARAPLASSVAYRRRLALEFSQSRAFKSAHTGGVTWLDLDHVEHRYLLAGAADASVAVYDTQQLPRDGSGSGSGRGTGSSGGGSGGNRGGGAGGEAEAVLALTKQSPGGHRFSVSSVAWYPVDTGLFVTGGYDNEVKVWDANTASVAAAFSLTTRVHAVAMSPCATSHCLVAVGSDNPQVMLCDVTSGGFTHTLTGHRAAVWAVHWSLQTEWHVMTGGRDGQLRLWDIRRAGPLHVFDQHQTQQAQRSSAEQAQQRPLPSSGSGSNKKRAKGLNGGSNGSASRGEQQGPRGSSGGGGSRGGSGFGQGGSSERMFLPDKVTRYATAHGDAITCVCPSPHGLYWLSAGKDDRVRLWDAHTYRHLLVNYPGAWNRALRARQLAVSDDSRVLFYPSGSAVQLYDVDQGSPLRVLQGAHFDTINCCRWNPVGEELYTGGNDCHIVVWASPAEEPCEEAAGEGGHGFADSDADNWSD